MPLQLPDITMHFIHYASSDCLVSCTAANRISLLRLMSIYVEDIMEITSLTSSNILRQLIYHKSYIIEIKWVFHSFSVF